LNAPKKAAQKRVATSWKTPGSVEDLIPVEQLAHGIVTERPDLMPSVERIMVADLDGDARLRALNLFNDSLSAPGDVHRDPRVAIARCQKDAAAANRSS